MRRTAWILLAVALAAGVGRYAWYRSTAAAIALLADGSPLISRVTEYVALLFSAAVGLFFGIYPADKASRLSPAEALRHL